MNMRIFRSMDISASALTAQRFRMDIIGENMANATNSRTENGQPYRRKAVVFQERPASGMPFSKFLQHSRFRLGNLTPGGVRVTRVIEDPSDFKLKYDPTHPDANEEGYVEMPNVDLEKEMVDMLVATRSYEANITALNNFKATAMKAIEIGR
jgi:flagellar basal-body rod protein FlgC